MIKQEMFLAPEGDATGGGDFLSSLAGEPSANEPAGNTATTTDAGHPAETPPAAAPAGDAPAPTPELPGWANATTKELRSDPRFMDFAKRYGKFDEVVKSAMDLTAKASEVPENLDGYELDIDPAVEYDQEQLKDFKQLAHKLGLTKAQAKELHKLASDKAKEQLTRQAEQEKQEQQARAAKEKSEAAAVDAALRKEWGKDYEANREVMIRGVKAYGNQNLMNTLTQAGLGNNQEVVMLFHRLGKLVQEDSALYRSGRQARDKSLEDIMYPGKK